MWREGSIFRKRFTRTFDKINLNAISCLFLLDKHNEKDAQQCRVAFRVNRYVNVEAAVFKFESLIRLYVNVVSILPHNTQIPSEYSRETYAKKEIIGCPRRYLRNEILATTKRCNFKYLSYPLFFGPNLQILRGLLHKSNSRSGKKVYNFLATRKYVRAGIFVHNGGFSARIPLCVRRRRELSVGMYKFNRRDVYLIIHRVGFRRVLYASSLWLH